MIYRLYSAAAPTIAAPAKVAVTASTIISLLQVVAQRRFTVLQWGISFDGVTAGTPILCELVDTGSVAATVTAHAAGDVVKIDDPSAPNPFTSDLTIGTSGCGFNASVEGTVASAREIDTQLIANTGQFIWPFPQDQLPIVALGNSLRIRVTAAANVNALGFIQIKV